MEGPRGIGEERWELLAPSARPPFDMIRSLKHELKMQDSVYVQKDVHVEATHQSTDSGTGRGTKTESGNTGRRQARQGKDEQDSS